METIIIGNLKNTAHFVEKNINSFIISVDVESILGELPTQSEVLQSHKIKITLEKIDETDLQKVKNLALSELKQEELRQAVDEYKANIKRKKSFWSWFPYKLVIIKKGDRGNG